jgi:hypothetical protein
MKSFTHLILSLLIISCTFVRSYSQFTSTPDTTALLNEEYTYDANAVGASSYTLVKALDDMEIVPSTGVITWTPSVLTSGGEVVIHTNNGFTQSFFIHVAAGYKCLTNAISYWKFDEVSGTTYEDSYGEHDAVAVATAPLDIIGKVSRAKDIPVANSTGMTVTDHADFHWGINESFSFSLWFKSDVEDRNNVGVILGRNEGAGANHWWIGVNENNELMVYVRDENYVDGYKDVYLSGSHLYQNLNWHHIVFIRDATSSKMKIYFDGALPVESGSSVDYPGSSDKFSSTISTPLSIGYLKPVGGEANYPMDGSIDELVFYDRAITPAEITELYNKGSQGHPACDEGYYAPLIVTTADSLADEDEDYSYQLIARDLDGDALTFNVLSKPTWMQTIIASNAITLHGTPENDDVGKSAVEVSVTANQVTIKQKFNLEVFNVNDAPVITGQADTVVTTAGSTVTVPLNYLTVTDDDNPSTDFHLVLKSGTGYTFSGSNITVNAGVTNSINVNAAVSDGTDTSAVFPMYVKINPTSGVDDLERFDSKFYPNPARDVIHFEVPVTATLRFELFDLAGSLVKKSEVENKSGYFDIEVSNLPAGIYSFKISNNKYISSGKLSIIK